MHRWERLFADLDAQFEESEHSELRSEVADRTRSELAKLRMADRLRAVAGRELVVWTLGGAAARGTVQACGPDWLLLTDTSGAETVVALAAVLKISGLGRRASVPGSEGRLAGRLRLSYVLRGIARDRAAVAVTLTDGSTVAGLVDRVGADHMDVSLDVSEAANATTLPFVAIAQVRRGR
ncbi:MAG TPA: hypothetical protein VFZ63_17640 [Jiangellaceae bacterium]